MYDRRSCSVACRKASAKSSCACVGVRCARNSPLQKLYVRRRFCFTPGGASKVTLRALLSRMDGKASCASLVSHRRNSGCGSSRLSSCSSVDTHGMTRWRFLRHSHSPFLEQSRSSCIAVSCCPPPMATWWNLLRPTVSYATPCNSTDGSAPGVVSRMIGSRQLVILSMPAMVVASLSVATPRASHAHWFMAAMRRSARKALTTMRRSKALSFCRNGGNLTSGAAELSQSYQRSVSLSWSFGISVGSAARSCLNAATLSLSTHVGTGSVLLSVAIDLSTK
mmetsp:Transcript_39653/g.122608  ORF Transcript_39653/g.122608 Transcript_39653/m.122608 type:complete len:280 (-) Transcript_39653:1317-2156(-)